MKNMKPNKDQEIIFPEGTGLVIHGLLEKYGLKEVHSAGIKNLMQAKTSKEKTEAAEKLPGRKIARILKDAAEQKIGLGNIDTEIQKRLGLPEIAAKKMAKDLEEKILALAEIVPIEKEIPTIKSTPPIKIREPVIETAIKRPGRRDVYRESVG